MPEIMAGVMIITIMGATGAVNVLKQVEGSRTGSTIQEMLAIRDAMLVYQTDNPGKTISTVTTLVTYDYLLKGVEDAPNSDLETDYKEDAWNNDCDFVWPALDERGTLTSAGPDGEMDTKTDNIVVALEKITP